MEKTFLKYRKEYELLIQNKDQGDFENLYSQFRSLKFARLLINNIEKNTEFKSFKIFVVPKKASKIKHKLLQVEYQIIGQVDKTIFNDEAQKIINKPHYQNLA